ncbi:MAG TPA: DUF2062 domain-containing protein [Nitrospirales bacterium]|nr:DUF2062 domain-containing protein [Nitrospirales bacterium]
MIPLTLIKDKFRLILHLGDSPQRTALAFALGAFLAFTPTYGLHIASAFLCAWVFRLNLVALMAGTFINNPWTLLPIVGTSLWVGLLLDPVGAPPEIDWSHFTVLMLWDQLRPFLLPFVLGHLILGIIAAAVGYVLVYVGILRFRAHQRGAKRVPGGESLRDEAK